MKFTSVLALLLILPFILAKKCTGKTKDKFVLSCKRGVIYKPNVSEDLGTCKSESCSGLSPGTLVTRNNCYWKESCEIQMQQVPMVTKCFGVPKSLTVHGGYCIPKYDAITLDICKGNNRMDSINDKTMIIRSHSLYPWDYSHLTFNNSSEGPKKCQKASSVRVDDVRSGNKVLAVTVEDVDIDTDMDNLWLQYGSSYKKEITKKETFTINLDKLEDISLIFRTNGSIPFHLKFDITDPSLTKGGRGFIICLRVLPRNAIVGRKSVCDEVIKKKGRGRMKIKKKSLKRRKKQRKDGKKRKNKSRNKKRG